jgi:crotonobetainyl-CoA:carnitine CoA-transferase CaiB-like acyl-CoA transferase
VNERADDRPGPLAGLRVIDLSTALPGGLVTMFLADAGAYVVLIEPPSGGPLRKRLDWPVLGRGKQSMVLDLRSHEGRAELNALLADADVLVTTYRPATLQALALRHEDLAETFPRLVSVAITGFGPRGPWADLKAYEGIVGAKLGLFHVKEKITARPGPAFVSVPFASWGAAQTAVHGVLSALYERESSGLGQQVDADLARGLNTIDTWNFYTEIVGIRWPDAFTVVSAFNDVGEVQAPLIYPLLAAPTNDGVWLQFAQTEPRLFAAMMKEFGLFELFADPKWEGIPVLPTQELRTELWELMIDRVGQRTLAEWEEVFATNGNVSAEIFRKGPDVFAHPQLAHDQRSVTIDDPEVGPVLQPSTLVHENERSLRVPRPAPRLGEHGGHAREVETTGRSSVTTEAPLAGVTVLDFGLMFAGPYGATLLADLGARVIKVETLTGDTIRGLVGFPESGGAKVMQGKESISLDLSTAEGKEIVYELVKRADIVLQSFRAGAAERAGVDAATLCALNPKLVYVNSPGYGTGAPYGSRPAYAPSIGAAGGLALTDAPGAMSATSTMEEKKTGAVRCYTAAAVVPAQVDGIAALGAASTMLLGLLARARGNLMGPLTVTMLSTATHAILDQVMDYPGKPALHEVDDDGYGPNALYRIYPAADGWVFLAAPRESDWDELVAGLAAYVPLGDDARFRSAADRTAHDGDLAGLLEKMFDTRSASDWERELTAAGIACVEVAQRSMQTILQVEPDATAEYCVTVESPVFDEHLRPGPATRFSRSSTTPKGFCLAGQHTDSILAELGYDGEQIADLRTREIVAG